MTEIAIHSDSGKPIKSVDFATEEDMNNKYPGYKYCPICNGALFFVAQHTRRLTNTGFPTPVASYFKHKDEEQERLCDTRKMSGESFDHLWTKLRVQERYKEASTLLGEKKIEVLVEKSYKKKDIFRKPDISIIRNQELIATSEVQYSAISEKSQKQRIIHHQNLGALVTDWRVNNRYEVVNRAIYTHGFAHTIETIRKPVKYIAPNGQEFERMETVDINFTYWDENMWNNTHSGITSTIENEAELLERFLKQNAINASNEITEKLQTLDKTNILDEPLDKPEGFQDSSRKFTPLEKLIDIGTHPDLLQGYQAKVIYEHWFKDAVIFSIDKSSDIAYVLPVYQTELVIIPINWLVIVDWQKEQSETQPIIQPVQQESLVIDKVEKLGTELPQRIKDILQRVRNNRHKVNINLMQCGLYQLAVNNDYLGEWTEIGVLAALGQRKYLFTKYEETVMTKVKL
jgi:hypothetical protein